VPPNAQYTFKHALVRDAAYESLLKSVRQQLHSRITRALDELGAPPELLAHHAEFAGELEQAIDWWQKAGEAAFARPAFEECIGHLGSAIRLVQQMGDDKSWATRELEIQGLLGPALIAKRGYSDRTTAEAFNRAMVLTEVVDDSELRFPILYGAWVGHYIRGELEQALKRASSALELADTQEDPVPRLVANRLVGTSHAIVGNFIEARSRLEIAEQIYDPGRHRALANRLGHEPGAAVHVYMAFVLWCLGYLELATSHAESAVSTVRESTHVSICHIDIHLGMYGQCRGDVHMVRRHGESIDQLADEYDMAQYRQYGEILLGWASVASGDESGIQRFQRGIESYTGAGALVFVPIFTTTFASLLLQLGRIKEAHQSIRLARQTMQNTGERLMEAELHRVEGEVYLRNSEQTKARTCYERAIETARNQNAKSWELRATTSLAALLGERGEKQHAHDLLDGVYGWFSEDLESQDLKKARLLLDQLT
jgi:predicted ATPase